MTGWREDQDELMRFWDGRRRERAAQIRRHDRGFVLAFVVSAVLWVLIVGGVWLALR